MLDRGKASCRDVRQGKSKLSDVKQGKSEVLRC